MLVYLVESWYTISKPSASLTVLLTVRLPDLQGSWLLNAENKVQEGQMGGGVDLIQESHDYLAAASTRLPHSERPWLGLDRSQRPNPHLQALSAGKSCLCLLERPWLGRNHCCFPHGAAVWDCTITENEQREKEGAKQTEGENRSEKMQRSEKNIHKLVVCVCGFFSFFLSFLSLQLL